MFDAEKVTELIAEARNKVTNAEYSRARGIGESTYSLELMVTALADALSSLRDAAEDAETEWEYAYQYRTFVDGPFDRVDAVNYALGSNVPWTLPELTAAVALVNQSRRMEYARVARRVKAGKWLPVPEGNQ